MTGVQTCALPIWITGDTAAVARECQALGIRYVGAAWIKGKGEFDAEAARKAAADFNRAGEVLAAHGIKVFYHCHGYEFKHRDERGRSLKWLTVIDEFTRECLAIRVARRINSFGVIETMADVMLERGVPEHIRSDNDPEMTAKIVRSWFAGLGATTLYVEPGSPWENGYCESFNGKLRDERLNGEIFYSLKEAAIVIEQWRRH